MVHASAPRRARGRCCATTAGTARLSPIEWLLLNGDFAVRKFEAPPPDIVFFDPFSFKTDSALWTLQAFRELASACGDKPTELFTYTYSTSVRAAMLAAGFYVAKGRATGPKGETTIGSVGARGAAAHGRELLGQEWLAKWARSDAQVPFGSAEQDDAWREAILAHPQFKALRSDPRRAVVDCDRAAVGAASEFLVETD